MGFDYSNNSGGRSVGRLGGETLRGIKVISIIITRST